MAVSVCRAKDPNSCRVHGNGGRYEVLQGIADEAAVVGDITLYMSTRAEMEGLSDEVSETFIAPDTGNLILESWLDKDGKIVPEAPNDMLLSNLYQSSSNPFSSPYQIEDMLRERGYTDRDLVNAKYFGFKKEDDDWNYREVGHMDIIRALTSVQQQIGIVPHTGQREEFIQSKFGSTRYGVDLSKAEAEKLMTDYKKALKDSYE